MKAQGRATARRAAPPATDWRLNGRADRHDALLDAAASEFNARGISGASLTHIASRVKLTRAALYYYFESREDLAFRCYQRACETTAEDLAAAETKGRNGLERIQGFIGRALAPERPPSVVLSEIAYLSEQRRAQIDAAHGRNVDRLQRFVRAGIRDGSIRRCDSQIAAQTIVGMMSWVPLAEEWSAGTGETAHRHAAQTFSDLIAEGVAADPERPFACSIDVGDLAVRPRNAFDRGQASAMKVELLTMTASRLFNKRGIDGTSLDQITRELGATKGAFYQYIRDKTSLIVQCHQRAMRLHSDIAAIAETAGRNGMERGMIGLHLLVQAFAGELAPLAPLTGVEALPAKARAPIRQQGLQLQRRYERFSHDGIADGSYRPFQVRTLAVTGAGAFSWIPKWRSNDDPRSPRVVADEIVALFRRGLRRR